MRGNLCRSTGEASSVLRPEAPEARHVVRVISGRHSRQLRAAGNELAVNLRADVAERRSVSSDAGRRARQ